jgi:putative membrane protein
MQPMYYNYGFVSPFHFIGSVISVIFWVAVVVFIIRLLKRGRREHWSHMWENRSALSLLRERFAKGEISKEEYQERKKVLEEK